MTIDKDQKVELSKATFVDRMGYFNPIEVSYDEAETKAMGLSINSPLAANIEQIANRIKAGEWDASKTLLTNLTPTVSPLDLSKDPSVIANEQIAASILKQELGPEYDFLKRDILTNDPTAVRSVARFYKRLFMIDEVYKEKLALAMEDRGLAEKIFEGVDFFFLRGMTLGWFEDAARRDERLGMETFQKMMEIDSDQEFKSYLKQTLDSLEKEGILNFGGRIFGGTNVNALDVRTATMKNMGYEPWQDMDQTMAILDMIATFAPAGFKAITGSGRIASGVMDVLRGVRASVLRARNPLQWNNASPRGNHVVSGLLTHNPNIVNSPNVRIITPGAMSGVQTNTRSGIYSIISTRNRYVQALKSWLPKLTDEIELEGIVNTRLRTLSNLVGSRIISAPAWGARVSERAQDVFTTVFDVGTPSGTAFAPLSSGGVNIQARNLLKKLQKELPDYEAQILRTDEGDVVRIRKDILESDTPRTLMDKGALTGIFDPLLRWVGGNKLLGDQALVAMRQQREAAVSGIVRGIEKDIPKLQRRAGLENAARIDELISEISNGPDSTQNKLWWDRSRLATEYRLRFGQNLDDATWEYYTGVTDLFDLDAWVKASVELKKVVEKGYVRLVGKNGNLVGRRRDRPDIKKDELILDLTTGGAHTRTTGLGNIYELSETVTVGNRKTRWATNPKGVELLELDDVFGFNAGPSRTNPNARYFLVSNVGGKIKTFMTAFTRKEASETVDSIRNIKRAEDNGTLTDNVIRDNNHWNPSLATVADWRIFKAENDLHGDIKFKNRDAPVTEDDGLSAFYEGDTWDAYQRKSGRGEVLMDYGGERTFNVDPFTALNQTLGASIRRIAYNQQTMKSLEAFRNLVDLELKDNANIVFKNNTGNPRLFDPMWVLENAEIKGHDVRHQRLKNMQQSIRNSLTATSKVEEWVRTHGNEAMEKILDKTHLKAFRKQMLSGDKLTRFMLTFNYHTTLGMMNLSQFFVQSFSAATSMAISPRYGLSAVALQPLFHAMSLTGDMDIRRGIAKIMSGLSGTTTAKIDADTFLEAYDYYLRSGRFLIDGSVTEFGSGAQLRLGTGGIWGSTKNVGQFALDAATFPFKMGEKVGRSTAIIIAHAEFKKKFPGKDINATSSQRWIADREQTLNMNMTAENHAKLQKGVFRLPAQWSGYMIRVTETMAFGGRMGLNWKERGRLVAFLTAGMGLGHLGMDETANGITENLGFKPGGDFWKYMQYGLVDGLLNHVGVPVSISERISMAASWDQFYKRFREIDSLEGVAEAVTGPGFSVFGKDTMALIDVVGSIGNFTEFTTESMNALRTINGFNNMYLAAGVLQHGFAKGRTGRITTTGEMGPMQAALYALGVKPVEQQVFMDKFQDYIGRKKDFKELRTKYSKEFREAQALMIEGNYNAAASRMKALNDSINVELNLTEKERNILRDMTLRPFVDETLSVARDLIDRGKYEEADIYLDIVYGEE